MDVLDFISVFVIEGVHIFLMFRLHIILFKTIPFCVTDLLFLLYLSEGKYNVPFVLPSGLPIFIRLASDRGKSTNKEVIREKT